MFCGNCGKDVDDGVEFCPYCSKSPKGEVAGDKDAKLASYPLIDLSSKLFYPMFEFVLWLFLIIGTVGGGITGYSINRIISNRNEGGTGAFLGVIIGFIVSFLVIIITGGLISIFLKINENIGKMLKK